MDYSRLEQLGLRVRQGPMGVEADLEPTTGQLCNPMTRVFFPLVTFAVYEDRLVPTAPTELAGGSPILLDQVSRGSDIEQYLVASLNDIIHHVSRRSTELAALGVEHQVDPASLQLTGQLRSGPMTFLLAADRSGAMHVSGAWRGNQPIAMEEPMLFELSQFHERAALESYLSALFTEPQAAHQPQGGAGPGRDGQLLTFGEVVERFGTPALLPPQSALELLVEVRVGGQSYRFAAARVQGRTFRGLLAGSSGKVWAERFELEEFPGVPQLVARVLSVPLTKVEVLGGAAR